jgi:hypothetical protein
MYTKEDYEKDSRAVCVAGDDPSLGMVLWYEGAWLYNEIHEAGVGLMLEDLGLYEAPKGVSIWEGRYKTEELETAYGREYDTEAVGTFRSLTQPEWVAFMNGDNPLEADFDAKIDVTVIQKKPLEKLTMTWGRGPGDDDVLDDVSKVKEVFEELEKAPAKLPDIVEIGGVKVVPGDNE